MPDLVSIIMPSYNSEKTISESINSVLDQTYQNWELLITDDCSTDNTIDIIKSYAVKDTRIKYYTNTENSGAGASRNHSIKHSKGRFIAFLDADDLWGSKKLEKQINFMKVNNIKFSYSYYIKFKSNNNSLSSIVKAPSKISFNKLIHSNVIGCLTAIYDSNTFGKRYMPLIRKRQDMGLWLELLKNIDYAYCIPEPLAYYRIDTGMTKNKFSAIKYQWIFYRKVMNLSLVKTLCIFPLYIYKGSIKKYFI